MRAPNACAGHAPRRALPIGLAGARLARLIREAPGLVNPTIVPTLLPANVPAMWRSMRPTDTLN
jgi:hypothetical protein